jgi:anaerobic selenocysteine-containing dehydrogenase
MQKKVDAPAPPNLRDAVLEAHEAARKAYEFVPGSFNTRIVASHKGIDRPIPARQRKWKTKSGRANFIAPPCLSEDPDLPQRRDGVLTLITVRSNDQFNTTIYGYEDRLRGIYGTREVVLMHETDMRSLGIADGEIVDLVGDAGDGIERQVLGFRATRYDVPRGSCAGYYPECNPLLPLWHHALRSHVPAAKSIPVRIRRHKAAA